MAFQGRTSILPVGEITGNGDVPDNFVSNRLNNSSTKPHRVYAPCENSQKLAIVEGDVICGRRGERIMREGKLVVKAIGFSSFDGELITNSDDSSQYKTYVVHGFAASNYAVGDDDAEPNGYSYMMGGTGTGFNNYTDTFYPGDDICVEYPSTDPTRRDEQNKARKYRPNTTVKRLTPLVRKFDPNNSVTHLHNGIWSIISDENANNLDLRRYARSVRNNTAQPSIPHQLGLLTAAQTFTSFFETLQVFVALGLVEFNYKALGDTNHSTDWLVNKAKRSTVIGFLDKMTFPKACSNTVEWDNGIPTLKSMDAKQLIAKRAERANFMGFLASLVSYITDYDAPKDLSFSATLVRTVLAKVHPSSIPEEAISKTFSPRHFMGPTSGAAAGTLREMALSGNNFIINSFVDNARTSYDTLARVFLTASYMGYGSIFCRSLSMSAPGQIFDYVN